jgi:AcrR family transcriptional regulator
VSNVDKVAVMPRWRRRRDARPAEIAEAALELFVEHGFAATRMEAIARRAGVTKGTLYLYFPSKEDLFRAVVKENVLPNLELGEKLVAEHTGSSAELLDLLVRRSWELMQTTRTACMPKLMLAEGKNFPELAKFYVDEVVQRVRRLFASVIERGIASGEFREVDTTRAAKLLMAPLHNLTTWRQSLMAFDPVEWDFEKYLDLHIEMFLRGLAKGAED